MAQVVAFRSPNIICAHTCYCRHYKSTVCFFVSISAYAAPVFMFIGGLADGGTIQNTLESMLIVISDTTRERERPK